ncbi:MAG: antibiotic biosynthesis monooxygenase [Sphingomonas sp.]|uniref:putative quinol monooxygenase n=1 Tax=Sphingomonas sp. TaxID=28214 RepID=UPI001AD59593|nr:putative quinol monooxygenase [Sphingomonas sp.]MBN8808448.1 antibiotic biosynthesis monooxygenase [Sphingomonas sp.]
MAAIVTVVHMHPKPGQRDALLAAVETIASDIRAEAGCDLYALHTTDDSVVTISKWADGDALAAHAKGEPVVRLRAAIADLVTGPSSILRLSPTNTASAERAEL